MCLKDLRVLSFFEWPLNSFTVYFMGCLLYINSEIPVMLFNHTNTCRSDQIEFKLNVSRTEKLNKYFNQNVWTHEFIHLEKLEASWSSIAS